MSILDKIDSLSKREKDISKAEFIVPLLHKNQKVVVKYEGFSYLFTLSGQLTEPNFYKVIPCEDQTLKIISKLHRKELSEYMKTFPSSKASVIGSDKNKKTLAIDTYGRIRPVYLTPANINTFDLIWVIFDGVNYYYKGEVRGSRKIRSHLQEQFNKEVIPDKLTKTKNMEPLHYLAYDEVFLKTLAKKKKDKAYTIKTLVNSMGGNLKGVENRRDGFIVKFEVDGETFRPFVDKEMRLISAGICLNSTDRIHDLSSFVRVAKEGLDRGLIHRTD